MKKYKFDSEIKKHEGKDATYIEVPIDVEKEFGAKRVKVKVKFDGVDYRGSIVKMGLPCYMIGITKEIRSKIGKTYGDIITVELEKDEEERKVELPEEFKEKLIKNNDAYKFYESLSYSQQRKYFQWITSARKEETKVKRMEEAIEKLTNKIKI
ncbi:MULTISPECIES: YdeI/OmpD-associated family protein [unclassified Clostridium]|uniref:YdeI/OmpD-associated family protein n=1 Tax=unclassified Clostridium TaxID=2614128 RepID=UPI001897A029|nr:MULTISPECIES: YdeI/OmpD-associated family protein [unclassified Clostridium]MCR1951109.1 YdeI/OmpD-associated family protein [Clostridium sp. DSM 100503]